LFKNVKGNCLVSASKLTGNIVLRSLEKGVVSKAALEAARKAIKKVIKKTGQLVLRTCAYLPITSKPSEVRMGKGKGKISDYVVPLKAGHVMFELKNVDEGMGVKALLRASVKLCVRTRVEILRDNFTEKPVFLQSK
jgi:large subunit ribosomal protein L16